MRVEVQLKAVDVLVMKMKMKQRTKNSIEKEEEEPILMFGFYGELGFYYKVEFVNKASGKFAYNKN